MHKQRFRFALLFLALGFILFQGLSAQAQVSNTTPTPDGPTAVELVSFTATPLDNAVRLVWVTATEDTVGFRIKRSLGNAAAEYLDALGDDESGIIYAQGGVSSGATYVRTDDTVLNGQVVTYILLEIENDGSESEPPDARRTVTVGIPPTNTAIPVAAVGSSTPTPTATRPLAVTASATQPAAGGSTAVPVIPPTATPVRFATITPSAGQPDQLATATAVPANTSTNTTTNTQPTRAAEPTSNPVFAAGVQAQAEITPLPAVPAAQDSYPGSNDAIFPTAELPASYPLDQVTPTASPQPTRINVIGNTQGYESAADGNSSQTTANRDSANSRGTLFLWIGFIVALLIFVTGVVGSIVLYTRKAG